MDQGRKQVHENHRHTKHNMPVLHYGLRIPPDQLVHDHNLFQYKKMGIRTKNNQFGFSLSILCMDNVKVSYGPTAFQTGRAFTDKPA